MSWFVDASPVLQAFLAGIFTWFVTGLGAATVLFTRRVSQKLLDTMMGFAAGVMVAASIWSLLLPAIEATGGSWVQASAGFLLGGLFLKFIDSVIPHLHLNFDPSEAEGIRPDRLRKTTLLVLAITMHNFPEGLAVGVAFGAVAANISGATLAGALALTLGIAVQNFPEGMAVSFPLRREGLSIKKSLWYGQLSAIVEPIGAVIAAAAFLVSRRLMPYALAFAAGAMIYVTVEELIPESQKNENADFATIGFLLGFVVMMILDVALS